MRLAAYLRVSTDRQDTDMQRHAIANWLAENAPQAAVEYYIDDGISGTKDNRPEFVRLCADANQFDTILTYRLDRLSRNAVTALRTILDWVRDDIEFVAVDQPILSATKGDPFRMTKLAMFAELAQVERETIVARTNAGLAAARARGVKLGPPRTISDDVRRAVLRGHAQGRSVRQLALAHGVSKSAVHSIVREGV